MEKRYKTINEYINNFPPDVQSILEKTRQTIREAAPEAMETISYQLPAFKLNGNLGDSRRLRITSGFIRHHLGLMPSRKNCPHTKKARALYSFC